jgi:hypothetical protein
VRSLLAFVVVAGPMAVLMVTMLALNRRDGRRDALRATIGVSLRQLGLRGMIAIHVRAGVWRGGCVTLDMRLCAYPQVWQAIDRVRPVLPTGVTLRVVATSPCRPRPSLPSHRAVVEVVIQA